MSQMTRVEYKVPAPSALSRHVVEQLAAGRVIGHKCPQCERVYVPPRGYCPLCVIATTAAHEVEIAARGVVTTYSVITPLQYPGQEEKADYVQATILLDGSHSTVGMQRMDGIPIADVHSGLRVEATWKSESERSVTPGGGMRSMGLGEAIGGWRPTGEPDAPLDEYADYVV
ncbi:MAG: Zn-ribbon domain-containing OB-fold protein [Actinomycetota bacterium]